MVIKTLVGLLLLVAYRIALLRSGEAGAAASEATLPVPLAAAEHQPP